LLGRDTRQWSSSWTVPELLQSQLRDVFENGNEDPQGEPAEVWWNHFSRPDSYCLIDSSWSLLSVSSPGTLKLLYVAKLDSSGDPVFCAVVKSISDANGTDVAGWTGAMPRAFQGKGVREVEIRWERASKELLPTPLSQDPGIGLAALLKDRLNPASAFDFDEQSKRGQVHAFLYPTETQFQRQGESWLFVLAAGKRKAFYPAKVPLPLDAYVIRTLRAGPSDLISRAPAISRLSTKSVTVIGSGAVGAPLAIELARNGVGELRLLDFDVVEPGNTVRWPLGSSAWGQLKTKALAEFIESEYPATKVRCVNHCLGTFSPDSGGGDTVALDTSLSGVDLVIDGTASFGTTSLIRDEVRSLPLLVLYASPSVAGGVVALFAPESGCPVCLECAWQDEPSTIKPPPGMFEEVELVQPPGCAERTFSGTFFDLQELPLQAARVVAGIFADDNTVSSSRVYTLSFHEEAGIRMPSWRKDVLARHPLCSCQR
jgi:molybdopterin/thiamine biosynthesis adenylyltransferase